jgi:hypothetical protein
MAHDEHFVFLAEFYEAVGLLEIIDVRLRVNRVPFHTVFGCDGIELGFYKG